MAEIPAYSQLPAFIRNDTALAYAFSNPNWFNSCAPLLKTVVMNVNGALYPTRNPIQIGNWIERENATFHGIIPLEYPASGSMHWQEEELTS